MASYIKASLERSYAESFLLELERNDNQYFLFVAKGTTWSGGENSPSLYTDTVVSEHQVMNDIIGYKKLNPENILFVLPRISWTSGTVYDQYDDSVELFKETDPKLFYVVTDENHIYKCLFNGKGSPSTQKPSLVITSPFTTSDGYTWKYLATVRESDLPYELTDYIPIDFSTISSDTETQNQYNVQATAVNGSITRIETTNASGASAGKYPYCIYRAPDQGIGGDTILRVAEVTATSDPTVKRVRLFDDSNGIIPRLKGSDSPQNYVGHIIRIEKNTSRPQEVNNYGVIIKTPITVSAREMIFEVKDDAINFNATVIPGSGGPPSAEILPYIKIVGDGTGAYAMPKMKAQTVALPFGVYRLDSTIENVDVVGAGRDYSKVSASVVGNLSSGTVHPSLKTVLSPKGGHGSNILKELNVKDVIIVVEVSVEDEDKLITGGSYRQFGIIKNPLLQDGTLAGKENKSFRNITLVTVGGANAVPSHFDLGESNLIIGKESYSTAKVVSVNSVNLDTISLKTENTYGKFVTRQDRSKDYILRLDRQNGASFRVGETVYQILPAGSVIGENTYGYSIQIQARVIQTSIDSLIVRVTTDGNFISSALYELSSTQSGQTGSILGVIPRYGENVWVTQSYPQGFLTTGSSDSAYKIYEISQPYFDRERTPIYRGLQILHVNSSVSGSTGSLDTTSIPLTPLTFSDGTVVEQGLSAAFGNYAKGFVYKWEYVNSTYGRLYLTDVLGSFKAVDPDGITGSVIGQYILSRIDHPEINKTSGEVVYIDNIRAINRVQGQEEEFRIRLGF